MAYAPQDVARAEAKQLAAANDTSAVVRVVAGPGTGKSRSIEERVDRLLAGGANPTHIFVISFTRATTFELRERIIRCATARGRGHLAALVNVSTMHALALRSLSRANLLAMFPTHPMILDDWEQRDVFDAEYVEEQSVPPTRAAQIRLAYDAYWQTLQPTALHGVSAAEQAAFLGFHGHRTTHLSCILAGEVVRRCVNNMRIGQLDPVQLLNIDHLVVDEFQDLNACDQEFVQTIHHLGSSLWVAGDDDQSIYSFRHADPSGLVGFPGTYAGSTSHTLDDCFRCTPTILARASALVSINTGRIPKNLVSLYATSNPPVQGFMEAWTLQTGLREARAIAESCRDLIAAGLRGSEILILLANRRMQLPLLESELSRAGVPFTAPRGPALTDTRMGRCLLALLRIQADQEDYIAHRTLLGLQAGVGIKTCVEISTASASANLNFRDLFYAPALPTGIFSSRAAKAITQLSKACGLLAGWQPGDLLSARDADIASVLAQVLVATSASGQAALNEWAALRTTLPNDMTIQELLSFVGADSELEQLRVLREVQSRCGLPQTGAPGVDDCVRVMTMHGSKGLSGTVVFIPGLEQEIHPSASGVASAGLLAERRRLLYVSITRARLCCILTRAAMRQGAQAQAMARGTHYNPVPSQFLNEMALPSPNRTAGLSGPEVTSLMNDVGNL